jgi:hypothetical protein
MRGVHEDDDDGGGDDGAAGGDDASAFDKARKRAQESAMERTKAAHTTLGGTWNTTSVASKSKGTRKRG